MWCQISQTHRYCAIWSQVTFALLRPAAPVCQDHNIGAGFFESSQSQSEWLITLSSIWQLSVYSTAHLLRRICAWSRSLYSHSSITYSTDPEISECWYQVVDITLFTPHIRKHIHCTQDFFPSIISQLLCTSCLTCHINPFHFLLTRFSFHKKEKKKMWAKSLYLKCKKDFSA